MRIAFIPARCGSKSIPFKNIKSFCGKPLIYWNLLAIEQCSSIDKAVVATDCDTIKDAVLALGLSKTSVYDRDAQNANDTASTESVMLEYIESAKLLDGDQFILVQATSPLTQSSDFDEAFQTLEKENADSLLSGIMTKRFFWNSDATPLNYDFKNRPRRQDFDGLFMENGAFYINSVKAIKESQNRLSGKIALHVMPEYTAVEIDEADDWLIAEKLMHKYILSQQPMPTIKLFLTDVDGVLTDAGMYYSESGDEMKRFNTHDGKGFDLLREAEIKIGIITSENTKMVERRAKKLSVDHLHQGKAFGGKLEAAKHICELEGIPLEQTAYIGDDVNCFDLLSHVGLAACPANALPKIKAIPGILQLQKSGGGGVVREFIEHILAHQSNQ